MAPQQAGKSVCDLVLAGGSEGLATGVFAAAQTLVALMGVRFPLLEARVIFVFGWMWNFPTLPVCVWQRGPQEAGEQSTPSPQWRVWWQPVGHKRSNSV